MTITSASLRKSDPIVGSYCYSPLVAARTLTGTRIQPNSQSHCAFVYMSNMAKVNPFQDMKTPEARNSRASDSGEAGLGEDQEVCHDAVFGEVTDKGPNYRNVSHSVPDTY